MADSYVGYAPASRLSLAPASVSVGNLNTTGTASSSTYLRGDMSWAANPLGDVVGPGSATDDALVKYDGTTGKLVQNSNTPSSILVTLSGIVIDLKLVQPSNTPIPILVTPSGMFIDSNI